MAPMKPEFKILMVNACNRYLDFTKDTPLDVVSYFGGLTVKPAIFQTAMRNIKVVNKNGIIYLENNGKYIGELFRAILSADVEEVISLLNYNGICTKQDVKEMRESIGDNPYRDLEMLKRYTDNNREKFGRFNVPIGEYDKLSESIKRELSTMEKVLIDKAKGKVLKLTVGDITVGDGCLRNALVKRVGCFKISKNSKGGLESCRVNDLTCDVTASTEPTLNCSTDLSSTKNFALKLMHVLGSTNDNNTKKRIATLTNIPIDELEGRMKEIVDGPNLFKLHEEMMRTNIPGLNHCGLNNSTYENTPCRTCDIFAVPTSTNHLAAAATDFSTAYTCVSNSTFIDVISDIMLSTEYNIIVGIPTDEEIKPPQPSTSAAAPQPMLSLAQLTEDTTDDSGKNDSSNNDATINKRFSLKFVVMSVILLIIVIFVGLLIFKSKTTSKNTLNNNDIDNDIYRSYI